MADDIDYGPLTHLAGRWQGNRGHDVSPEPDGRERSDYYETLVIEPAGDVDNAESQTLVAMRYVQEVRRISNDKVFHVETGFWMWDAATGVIMKGFAIPRGVSVLAGGEAHTAADTDAGTTVLTVTAAADDPRWSIAQSPFMQQNAMTTAYTHTCRISADQLEYEQTMTLQIYDREFQHTDQSVLSRAD